MGALNKKGLLRTVTDLSLLACYLRLIQKHNTNGHQRSLEAQRNGPFCISESWYDFLAGN